MTKEYLVYSSKVIPSKKEFPQVVYTYLSGSLWQPYYTDDINYATKFYKIDEVKEIADLLGMEVGEVVIKVKKV